MYLIISHFTFFSCFTFDWCNCKSLNPPYWFASLFLFILSLSRLFFFFFYCQVVEDLFWRQHVKIPKNRNALSKAPRWKVRALVPMPENSAGEFLAGMCITGNCTRRNSRGANMRFSPRFVENDFKVLSVDGCPSLHSLHLFTKCFDFRFSVSQWVVLIELSASVRSDSFGVILHPLGWIHFQTDCRRRRQTVARVLWFQFQALRSNVSWKDWHRRSCVHW